MKKARDAYAKVEAYLAKHPNCTKEKAAAAVGVTIGSYYRGALEAAEKKSGGRKKSVKADPLVHVALPTQESGKLMVLIGTVEQIRGIIS